MHDPELLLCVLDSIPEVTMVVDREYRVIFANRAARQWAGGRDPVAGCLKCYKVSHQRNLPCDGIEHPCPLAGVLETGQTMTVTHTHRAADGRELVVEVTAAPLRDGSGQIVGIIESCCDVTRLREVQQQADDLRQALEDRKLIERAKGIVMKRAQLDEQAAFRRLQKLASEKNLKLVVLARTLLTAEEAWQGADEP